ncbi:hypothetical protein [Frigoriglobus tundricola]|uniref:Uncharacterized protein n=1 Tax=Frigoriglobus tundricola TaxID=2774151 RepID=A0A6M5YX25_9BACT|nr:hypothetical protein [Frigoriglobus tundricola]QJW97841.1 hypothetical protein FTUN_5421 [Frigoriglobus tundricola]
MSAGFKVAGEVFWGTNGAVEAYLEALAGRAVTSFGAADPLSVFLRDECDGFSMGKIVYLDEWLRDALARDRFLELLDAATDQLRRDGTFSEYGREWVSSVVSELRVRIVAADPSHTGDQ